MKNRTIRQAVIALALMLVVGVLCMALKPFNDGQTQQINTVRTQNLNVVTGGTSTLAGTLSVTGTVTVTGTLTHGKRVLANTNAVITSPSTTISAAATTERITLTSDESITGITITGATLGEVIVIVAGTDGTNTMQFDDGTSYTLGGNRVLTEGNGSVLGLLCTSADGDDFTQMFFSAN